MLPVDGDLVLQIEKGASDEKLDSNNNPAEISRAAEKNAMILRNILLTGILQQEQSCVATYRLSRRL